MSSQAQKAGSERSELAPLSGNAPGVFASPPAAKGVKTLLDVRPASPSADGVLSEVDLERADLERMAAEAAHLAEVSKDKLMAHLERKRATAEEKAAMAEQRAAEAERRVAELEKEKASMVQVMVESVMRLKVTSEAVTDAHQTYKTLVGAMAALAPKIAAALESRKL